MCFKTSTAIGIGLLLFSCSKVFAGVDQYADPWQFDFNEPHSISQSGNGSGYYAINEIPGYPLATSSSSGDGLNAASADASYFRKWYRAVANTNVFFTEDARVDANTTGSSGQQYAEGLLSAESGLDITNSNSLPLSKNQVYSISLSKPAINNRLYVERARVKAYSRSNSYAQAWVNSSF